MKTKYILLTGAASLALAFASNAQSVLSLNFASTPGSTIQFNGAGSSLQFNPSTSSIFGGVFNGTQWQIGSETGGDGSAIGLLGVFNNGPFSYGAITTVISGTHIDQTASLTGSPGSLMINDGSGFDLVGTINWVEVATHDYAGAINAALTVNITDLTYAGANSDLTALTANGVAALNLTFQFSPGETLADLTTGSTPFQTSYSGSIASVPEPTSVACYFLGTAILICSRLFRQKKHI
jgi:hypothetical protein